jgi:hypothetical protein
MNTSFGPRIDEDRWDFHDGIDLPAPKGTEIHAMRGGRVHHAGPRGTGGNSSRHVVIQVAEPIDSPIYNIYLHLDSIDPAILPNASIEQGQVIGTVGHDDATYCHLHMEYRKGTRKQIGSVHPLHYLPYSDIPNLRAPVADRFNRLDGFMAARLLFGANSKLEGDLRRVEVDLRRGTPLLTTRIVDFDDKSTVVEGKGDQYIYVDDLGIEGYQKSNMVKGKDGPGVIKLGIWRKWRLELLRVATRETTAILYLDQGGRMIEQARLNWESSAHQPLSLRVGIGFSPPGAAATVLVNELWLTESELSS